MESLKICSQTVQFEGVVQTHRSTHPRKKDIIMAMMSSVVRLILTTRPTVRFCT